MKRIGIILAAIFTAIGLAACSGTGGQTTPVERVVPGDAVVYGDALLRERGVAEDSIPVNVSIPDDQGRGAFFAGIELVGRTREGFIQDFDYLMWILDENYPYFGVIQRKLGVDMHEIAAAVREKVADESNDIDSQVFYDLLQEHFFPHADAVGHLGLVSIYHYHERLNLIHEMGYELHPNMPAMTDPASVEFYGELMPMDEIEPRYITMGYESNLVFDIIDEGYIAYMKLVTMQSDDFERDVAIMTEFYERISGFEHFIVDIRSNPGGQPLFDYLILGPNLTEDLSVPVRGFYRAGSNNVRFLKLWDFFPEPASLVDKAEIPEFNEDDLQFVDYMVALPPRLADTEPMWIDLPQYGFDGRIWLLIDGDGRSASEIAAYMSKQSGIITLVGEQSGGCIGGTEAAWVSLPNSGIIIRYDPVLITDENGRSLNEFPTMPHYFNYPGMDALETVLELIREGG